MERVVKGEITDRGGRSDGTESIKVMMKTVTLHLYLSVSRL